MERLIKRYQNRKLYDTTDKTYVKLADIETMICRNETVKVIDNVTGEEITRQILTQLIMRSEPRNSDTRVPLEGLRDMIQNDDSPIFQAFRGMMNLGRDMVQQIRGQATDPETDSSNRGGQFRALTDMVRTVSDRVSERAANLVNGTLAREMLNVPTRDDWNRVEAKFTELEQKLSALEVNGGSRNE